MPNLFSTLGYKVYFWTNENGEPIHVHVCKGNPTANTTKIWITAKGYTVICNNRSRIPEKELNKICKAIQANTNTIQDKWIHLFGQIKYYC